jgi:hypothetical protein
VNLVANVVDPCKTRLSDRAALMPEETSYHHGEKKPVTAQFKKPDEGIFHGNHSRTRIGKATIAG